MDKVIWLHTAQQLQNMADQPKAQYCLGADIDLAEENWKPVPEFSGSLDGNGYVIRNLRVTGEEESVGLFGVLSGTVKQLKLENVVIHAGKRVRNAGAFAGIVTGSLENCTAEGMICADHENLCAGSLAGKVVAGGTVLGGDTLTVTAGPDGKYKTEGLSADVRLFVPDTAKTGLVGVAEAGSRVSGLWKDSANSTQRQPEVLQQRRKKVIAYMRSMGTVLWRVDQELLEYIKNDKKEPCIHYQRYEKGKTYMGIPYNHSAGSRGRFLSQMAAVDTQGVYTAMSGLENGRYYNGQYAEELADQGIQDRDQFGFICYMGNDCSSAVSWSWRQVSSVDVTEGGCHGLLSGEMMPTAENQAQFGILPAGNWQAKTTDSVLTYEQEGEQAFLEAYARARMGDAIVGYHNGGHVRLLSYDPVVIRDPAGKVDAHKSFFITIEQGDGFFTSKTLDNCTRPDLEEPINYSWRVDFRHGFWNLLHHDHFTDKAQHRAVVGCGYHYLPITMRALQEVDTPAVTPRVWLEGAVVRSNFYIISTQVEGAPVYTHVAQHWEDYRKDPVTAVDLAAVHNLTPGIYEAKIQLSNEQIETVCFTVK